MGKTNEPKKNEDEKYRECTMYILSLQQFYEIRFSNRMRLNNESDGD